MFIVAERINSSRKSISEAIKAQDADFIHQEAKAQTEAGANYIDVNAGSFVGQEGEYLCTMEKQRLKGMLPLVKQYQSKIVVLCQSDEGMANTVEEKVDIAQQMVQLLGQEGVAPDDIYIDPLIYPIATDTKSAVAAMGAMREIGQRFPEVHTIAGLTNVSFGLPVRKLVNRTFLVAAMAHGLDSAIIDPTDRELMASLRAAEVVLNRDQFCANYITAYREGKLA
jgi:5-methyltetrahydrofolate--homocysteine methyltransferase